MKKGLLMMLCLSLLAFAPACRKTNESKSSKPVSKKTTKVKTKNTYKSRNTKPAKSKTKKVVIEESAK